MPFDFKEYQTKCDGMSTEQLHKEWENYTRQISGGATGTATSVLFAPVTGGISLVGLGLSAPKIHNARKKREIIEAGLKARGTTHDTRKRDVIVPMAITGAIGGLTVGLAGPAAGLMTDQVVGHGIEYAAAHVALDAGGAAFEHQHGKHEKNKADAKLQAQYENFKIQYAQEQAKLQGTQYPVGGYQPGMVIPGSIQNSGPPPPYQPQGPSQDQKYEVVPIPTSYNEKPQAAQPTSIQQQTAFTAAAAIQVNYQPASHQQAFAPAQQAQQFQQQLNISTPQQPVYNQQVSGYPPEKQPMNSYPAPSPCPTPLPVYSPPAQQNTQPIRQQSVHIQHQSTVQQYAIPVQHTPPPLQQYSVPVQQHDTSQQNVVPVQHTPPPLQHRPSLSTPAPATPHMPIHRPSLPLSPPPTSHPVTYQEPIYELPEVLTLIRTDSVTNMEEELMLLRMKVLQMELDKRGDHVELDKTKIHQATVEDAIDGEDKPKPPEVPEVFPTATFAPEPPRKRQDTVHETNEQPSEPVPEPKINVFVDIQQPAPLKISKQTQPPSRQSTMPLPYPTFTPRPEQQFQHPSHQTTPPPMAAQTVQEPAKHGLSITGGIAISYDRDSVQAQPAVHQEPISHAPTPQPQQDTTTYQAYNPHQRAASVAMSPQQQYAPPNQGAPISYTPAPSQQESYNAIQQAPPVQEAPISYTPAPTQQQAYQQAPPAQHIQHQQTLPTYQKPPHPLQHQDSGYYSNPPTRHSSSFSVSTVASMNLNNNQQHIVSPPTPQYASLSPQNISPPQTQYQHARQPSYGQMPMTYTPAPMTPQQTNGGYFPPPPPAQGKDHFAQRTPISPQGTGYQPLATPVYGQAQNAYQQPQTQYGAQRGMDQGQGWQWGNPTAGAPGEPNYGAPPPIPGQWRGS